MQNLRTLQPGIIRLSELHGKQLAELHGEELVKEYRTGTPQRELARKYSPDWPISENVARSAVAKALELLIDEEERATIQSERNRVNGQRASKIWTREKLIARTEKREQKSYIGNKIKTEYGEIEEKDYYFRLVHNQLEANANSGRRKKVNWREVAEKTNALFGNNRNPIQLYRHYRETISRK